ncbi:DUF2157 domain-containing protein [Halopseudomonas salegens]|uniref:Predicted membrane protein n=1 Tax=Halopseudomonas salegens TaxID=1434072 RepID=A0A1H2G4V9_9GAMM|nr:DUF2157 domain-containing protein [Halopseudomonas salegens]SDU14643.1 Predicted membrane protein [Halopseudomonas salegens]
MRRQRLQEADTCLHWAEQGMLPADALARIESGRPLRAQMADWERLLNQVLLLGGVLLLVSGIIFFFAWNWASLARGYKLALALGVLSTFVASAWFSVNRPLVHQAMLLGACLMTGALLALIGQTYQSGADIWQLFAVWAVLILPWAWYSASRACWLLVWVLLNLALWRYFSHSIVWSLFNRWDPQDAMLWVALINLAVLLLFEGFGLRWFALQSRLMQRLSAMVVLGCLGVGGMFVWWESRFAVLAICLALVLLAGMPFYRWIRPDLSLLALQSFTLIAVTTSGLARILEKTDAFFLFNGLGLFVIGSSALASIWLHRLHKEGL